MTTELQNRPAANQVSQCLCGSGKSYADCCQPLHLGSVAETPEALMRSRYTAFVKKLSEYLLQTWHPSTRPGQLDLSESPGWVSLEVLDSNRQNDKGQVHFRAICRTDKGWGYLEEHSDFVREAGRWYYLRGKTRDGQLKPGRNDPCPCGSGRKFKQCCG